MKAGLAARRIERVSTYEAACLDAQGLAPRVPAAIAALAEREGSMPPTFWLANELTWLVQRQGSKVVGIASYQQRFDYHTMLFVREVTSIAGSRRSVIELIRHIVAEAKYEGLGVLGSIDPGNVAMADLIDRMGYRSRSAWEA